MHNKNNSLLFAAFSWLKNKESEHILLNQESLRTVEYFSTNPQNSKSGMRWEIKDGGGSVCALKGKYILPPQ